MSKDIFVIVEQRNGAVQKVNYGSSASSSATKLSADLGEQVVAVLLGLHTRSLTRRKP